MSSGYFNYPLTHAQFIDFQLGLMYEFTVDDDGIILAIVLIMLVALTRYGAAMKKLLDAITFLLFHCYFFIELELLAQRPPTASALASVSV